MVLACISRRNIEKKVHRKQRTTDNELGVTKFHWRTAIASALVRDNTLPESRSKHRHVGNTIRKVKTQKRTRLTFIRSCTCTLFRKRREKKKRRRSMQRETARDIRIRKFDQRDSTTHSSSKRLVDKKNRARTTIIYPPQCHLCPPVDNIRTTHPYAHERTHTHAHTLIQKPKARTISIREIIRGSEKKKRGKKKKKEKGKKGIDA